MQTNDERSPGGEGSEDTTRAVEHVQNVERNRDALEAQARRTDATTPAGVGEEAARGTPGTQHASEDPTRAAEHAHAAAENRDALAEQARRTEATTSLPHTGRDGNREGQG